VWSWFSGDLESGGAGAVPVATITCSGSGALICQFNLIMKSTVSQKR
jgi:hypothetical protein